MSRSVEHQTVKRTKSVLVVVAAGVAVTVAAAMAAGAVVRASVPTKSGVTISIPNGTHFADDAPLDVSLGTFASTTSEVAMFTAGIAPRSKTGQGYVRCDLTIG